jgi:hypothetical protein
MDFETAAKIGAYISKDYTESFLRLLVIYKDISASEAASRLNIHIGTAQDFLEAMVVLDIVSKREVSEKKRPYFRYFLNKQKISLELDLGELKNSQVDEQLYMKIREKKDADARFSKARGGDRIAGVTVWAGEGRARTERRINLTSPQGRFLRELPLPGDDYQSISVIMYRADIDDALAPEILDIVELLTEFGVIEVRK